MIALSILFQNIGKFICLKLFKTSLRNIRKQWHWKRFVYEFSGTIFLFLLIFISYSAYLLSQEKAYLAFNNLTYGIETNEAAKQIGFKDGDKLISLNGKEMKSFIPRYFTTDVLLSENTYIEINRNGEDMRIKISNEQKKEILKDRDKFITPRFPEKLTPTRENYTIQEILSNFYRLMRNAGAQMKLLVLHTTLIRDGYKVVHHFPKIQIVNFTTGYHVFLNASAILIWINLLPIPGLDMGNTIIAIIEKKRKKIIAAKKLRAMRLIGIGTLICWILISVFLL